MSLKRFVESQIEQDLNELENNLQAELSQVQKKSSHKVAQVERIYKNEIDHAIESELNLRSFLSQKERSFFESQSLQDQIRDLYHDLLPDIMTTAFATQKLDQFLIKATPDTEFTLVGTQKDLLSDILKKRGFKNISFQNQASTLGSITYTTPSATLEFDCEDFLSEVKDQTLSHILQTT